MNRKKTRKRKNKTLYIFAIYTLSIISISLFLITFLTIKTQCSKLINEICELEKATI